MDLAFLAYTRSKSFHEATVQRLSGLAPGDQNAIMQMVVALKASENHVRDMLDWLQEISLRDGTAIKDVLGRDAIGGILTDPRLGRSDRLRRVKEELRRIRLPRLSRIEDEIAARIQTLKLGPDVQITVPAGLEGGYLTVRLKARSQQELGRLAGALAQAADRSEVREIFSLLAGHGPGEEKNS